MGQTNKNIIIAASEGQISAAIHLPDDLPAPVVVCCHGMFSSKDTQKYIALGKVCSDAGIALVRFDFAGCGETTAPLGGDLISSRLRDLIEVTSYVLTQTWCNGSLGLFGSSLGGFISLLMAGSHKVQVAAIVSWAAPCDLERIVLPSRDLNALRDYFPEGFGLGKPSNLKQILSSASHVLVIHGKQDEVVLWTEALAIYLIAREPKRLLMMEETEHRFLDTRSREFALFASRDWFVKYLFA